LRRCRPLPAPGLELAVLARRRLPLDSGAIGSVPSLPRRVQPADAERRTGARFSPFPLCGLPTTGAALLPLRHRSAVLRPGLQRRGPPGRQAGGGVEVPADRERPLASSAASGYPSCPATGRAAAPVVGVRKCDASYSPTGRGRPIPGPGNRGGGVAGAVTTHRGGGVRRLRRSVPAVCPQELPAATAASLPRMPLGPSARAAQG